MAVRESNVVWLILTNCPAQTNAENICSNVKKCDAVTYINEGMQMGNEFAAIGKALYYAVCRIKTETPAFSSVC